MSVHYCDSKGRGEIKEVEYNNEYDLHSIANLMLINAYDHLKLDKAVVSGCS